MTHRYALAAVLLAALSVPAAAQQTTPSDTSKKSTSGTTVTESAGSIADTAAKANANPNAAAPSTAAPSTMAPTPGATVTTPSTTAPSAPSAAPSAGATVTAPAPATENAASAPSAASAGATGQIQPTSGTIKVDVKVAESLANTVKISADSAFALAKASPDAGEISSAELEMTDNRLVYQVKMVKGAGASTVYVDAMTGEVVKDKKFGGLKAAAENQEESQKLLEAKEKEQKQIKEEKKAP